MFLSKPLWVLLIKHKFVGLIENRNFSPNSRDMENGGHSSCRVGVIWPVS